MQSNEMDEQQPDEKREAVLFRACMNSVVMTGIRMCPTAMCFSLSKRMASTPSNDPLNTHGVMSECAVRLSFFIFFLSLSFSNSLLLLFFFTKNSHFFFFFFKASIHDFAV